MLALTIRLIVSLSVVVGLLLLIARFGARRFRGGADSLVQVVHRQALSRTTAVAVISVGTRVLVLGTTENQVTVLAELDPHEIDASEVDLDAFPGSEEPPVVAAEVLPPRPQARAASRPMAPPAPHVGHHRPAARVAETPPVTPTAAELILAAAAQHEADRTARTLPVEAPVELPAALAILAEESTPAGRRTPLAAVPTPVPASGPLAGSVLSAQTWKQAFAAARGSKQAS